MISKKYIFILITILFMDIQTTFGAENEYGTIKAMYNGKNATVNGVQLKIGEPFEIEVDVVSRIDGHVTLLLQEPGITKSFEVLSGPSKIEEKISNLNIEAGWAKKYTWTLSPNGAWKNGNAPINLLVKFYNIKTKNDKIVQFTISNPYILDEQYTGSPTTTTVALKTTESGTPVKSAPSTSVLIVLAMLLLAWRWQR